MIKHINKIAIEVLRDRFPDYDWHSNHYDEEYKMIVKAIDLAKNNESLHDVSGCLDYESFSNTPDAVSWVNRNKDKTLVTITSEQYGVTVYYR